MPRLPNPDNATRTKKKSLCSLYNMGRGDIIRNFYRKWNRPEALETKGCQCLSNRYILKVRGGRQIARRRPRPVIRLGSNRCDDSITATIIARNPQRRPASTSKAQRSHGMFTVPPARVRSGRAQANGDALDSGDQRQDAARNPLAHIDPTGRWWQETERQRPGLLPISPTGR